MKKETKEVGREHIVECQAVLNNYFIYSNVLYKALLILKNTSLESIKYKFPAYQVNNRLTIPLFKNYFIIYNIKYAETNILMFEIVFKNFTYVYLSHGVSWCIN